MGEKIEQQGGFPSSVGQYNPNIQVSAGVGPVMRQFETGATRDLDDDKIDFEGFLSPLVLARYGLYMHRHRRQVDGSLRPSDNWQKGIPMTVYMKSMWRHFWEVWHLHRKGANNEAKQEALCAVLFNVMGYLHELLREHAVNQGSK